MKRIINLFILSLVLSNLSAQPTKKAINIIVSPDSETWLYETGENANFHIAVTRNNFPVKDVEIRYEISYDMMSPHIIKNETLKNGTIHIDIGTMVTPGFVRCRVFATCDGNEYEGRATVGFSPEKIIPTTNMPEDFLDFWGKAKTENSKIPIRPTATLLPERCTDKVNVYEISFRNYRKNSRIYGVLSIPKEKGEYPAIIKFPGAGVKPQQGDVKSAERGFILLEIGIHGIPVTLPEHLYDELKTTALNGYQFHNWDERDMVYYKRVYLGCLKAVDYIYSLEEFDKEHLYTYGGSQGGALAIITAALDNRVKGVVSIHPALSDMNGYLYNRAGGWPHYFKIFSNQDSCLLTQKERTAAYYDVVNFAQLLKVPVFYTFGYNDMVCPPTSTYAAWNVIQSPKTICLTPDTEHYTYPETLTTIWEWFIDQIAK